ncbi:hypothetical protein [Francisella philomiragia]|uniref:Uncharacterized protein n=1 Tax=Francisella philomiragia TaxID=28110 RepID=A0ABS1GD10_9GAMM|nr:hypothetical protein [Francisella philomiragia]MBK2259001.1 hypothetical protein [Francisella philomiragia]MBK2302692.1 hypothetical protein [Francisella philomiragia]
MSVFDLTKKYKTHAWSHHEYDYKNKNNQTHDSTYLLNDIDLDKLPKSWEVVKTFKYTLSQQALYNCMLEIDHDLSRFSVYFDCKLSSIEQLSEILGVDLVKEYNLYLDDNSVYTGFWFDGKTGELLYIRKAVNIIKKNEIGFSKEDFEKELVNVCSKFDIFDIPNIFYMPNMAVNPFYTFELHKGGVIKKLQFEIFTKNQYFMLNNYINDDIINFISSINQEQIYPYITHYKIDYIDGVWQLVKIYFCGLSNECEFLKKDNFTEYKYNRFVNENEVIESLSDRLKRLTNAGQLL